MVGDTALHSICPSFSSPPPGITWFLLLAELADYLLLLSDIIFARLGIWPARGSSFHVVSSGQYYLVGASGRICGACDVSYTVRSFSVAGVWVRPLELARSMRDFGFAQTGRSREN